MLIWSKFGPKSGKLVFEWITFLWKIGICMGHTFNFSAARLYQKPKVSTPV